MYHSEYNLKGQRCIVHNTMAASSSNTEQIPESYLYDGLRLPTTMPPAAVDAVRKLELYPDDLLILSYPKSGTTWLRENTWLIMHDADIEASLRTHQHHRVPCLEYQFPNMEEPEVFRMSKIPPRIMTSHLPGRFLENQLKDGGTKVLVIMRDLKDTLVSFFNFYKNNTIIAYKGSWNTFFDLFKKGLLNCGDWGEFYSSWWVYKEDPKFLFLRYEELKTNHGECVRMIAKHCNKTLTKEQVDRIVKHTSFDEMKKNPMVNNPVFCDFYRKGVVGDWVNYFTTEQLCYIEKYEKEVDFIV